MLQERRLEISRDNWKEKAVVRATELREARKEKRKDRECIQRVIDENRRLKKELKKKMNSSTPSYPPPVQ